MYKCSLISSYSILFNSLNMSSNNMLLRRKTNAKVGTVERLAVKRAFSCFFLKQFHINIQGKKIGNITFA